MGEVKVLEACLLQCLLTRLEKIVTGDWHAKFHVDFCLPLHVDCGH